MSFFGERKDNTYLFLFFVFLLQEVGTGATYLGSIFLRAKTNPYHKVYLDKSGTSPQGEDATEIAKKKQFG
jgi:hypothetical protein